MPPDSGNPDNISPLEMAQAGLREARHAAARSPAGKMQLAEALETLASLHSAAGEFARAESNYLEAIPAAEAAGAPSAQMARLCSGLGMLYDFNQREAQAVPLYERALDIYGRMESPPVEQAAELHNNLAMIYKSLGRHPLAEQHYLMALESLENLHGRDHERVAAVYNNLGTLYYSANHPHQAREMHSQALEIRQNVFGPYHPEVGQTWCNLGAAAYAQEDDAATQENYEKGLRILERCLPLSAAIYEQMMTDYAGVLESIGEEKKAETLRKRMSKALNRP